MCGLHPDPRVAPEVPWGGAPPNTVLRPLDPRPKASLPLPVRGRWGGEPEATGGRPDVRLAVAPHSPRIRTRIGDRGGRVCATEPDSVVPTPSGRAGSGQRSACQLRLLWNDQGHAVPTRARCRGFCGLRAACLEGLLPGAICRGHRRCPTWAWPMHRHTCSMRKRGSPCRLTLDAEPCRRRGTQSQTKHGEAATLENLRDTARKRVLRVSATGSGQAPPPLESVTPAPPCRTRATRCGDTVVPHMMSRLVPPEMRAQARVASS